MKTKITNKETGQVLTGAVVPPAWKDANKLVFRIDGCRIANYLVASEWDILVPLPTEPGLYRLGLHGPTETVLLLSENGSWSRVDTSGPGTLTPCPAGSLEPYSDTITRLGL